ncbi:hypothetical protein D3C87_931520 [compost metagenome]
MRNKGDLVFEQIAPDIYVMIANRYNKVDLKVYSQSDFENLVHMGYRVELQEVTSKHT